MVVTLMLPAQAAASTVVVLVHPPYVHRCEGAPQTVLAALPSSRQERLHEEARPLRVRELFRDQNHLPAG